MTIDQELLRGLDWNRGLHSALTKGLEITGPGSLDKAKEYLQEPPDVKSRRESLSKKRERLLSAKRELQSLGSFQPVTIPPPPGKVEPSVTSDDDPDTPEPSSPIPEPPKPTWPTPTERSQPASSRPPVSPLLDRPPIPSERDGGWGPVARGIRYMRPSDG